MMHRKESVCCGKRKSLKAGNATTSKSKMTRPRKSYSKLKPEVRQAVYDWVVNHENVIHSLIFNDTLLLELTGSTLPKRRIGKLLLEIPVRDLHNHLVSPLEEGGLPQARNKDGIVMVSNTALRRIIKEDIPQL